MIAAIANESLIAKEFKRHYQRYIDYTRIVSTNNNSESGLYEKGDYKAVCQIIDKEILRNHKCISMDLLLEKYGIGLRSKLQYRNLLKNRLMPTYGCSLLFISPEYHSSQLVISRDYLQSYDLSSTIEFSDEFFIQKAEKILRNAVLSKIINASDLPWPPTVESLQRKSRDHPEILKQFYMNLLWDDDNHHKISERVKNGSIENTGCQLRYLFGYS